MEPVEVTWPDAGRPSPARIRVRVVLPAPLRPTSPTLSPGPTRKETSCISNRAPARTSSCWALIIRLASLGRPAEGCAPPPSHEHDAHDAHDAPDGPQTPHG